RRTRGTPASSSGACRGRRSQRNGRSRALATCYGR
ncbi:MAG TPA: hypothetical protein DF480_06285, partial [Clostridiales bacterium]|nr:hypothetical protein [Clostridiales bacterium]